MKIRKCFVIFLAALFVLAACGERERIADIADMVEAIPDTESRLVYDEPEAGKAAAAEEIPSTIQYDDSVEESFLDDTVSETEKRAALTGSDADSCIVYSDETLKEVMEMQSGRYYFEQLPQNEKVVYAQILRSIQEFESNVEVSTMDAKVIERAFQCVMNDHPEIFYVQGFTYIKYTLGDELKKISFSGTATMDEAERDARMSPIRQYVTKAISGITGDMDDYTKIKTIYQYIVENTEYDSHSVDNQNICSVFLSGRSVCQGYAKAMQYLLNEVGVNATLVLGTVSGGQGHAWNLVKSDGEYYYVDVTWGDASYRAMNDANADVKYRPNINYDYLCVTTEQICRTHQLSSPVKLPVCVAVKDNYYRREGALFSSVDKDRLKELFEKGYESDTPYITLKCASREAYDAMYEYLITQQHIFRYLSGAGGSVKYTNDDNQWSMSFWL